MNEQSLKPIIGKLEDLFVKFNDKFYGGQLQQPIITALKKDDGFYEINLCAEYLSRPFEQVAETLLHEMVHLFNLQENVQDTSRGGTYHNKKYKDAAEAHGLTVEKDKKYGWNKTKLNADAKAYVDSLQDKKFQLYRKIIPEVSTTKKSKQSSRKYIYAPDAVA